VYEDARVALSLGILVQVFTGDLDPSTLPPVFRARPLISIMDGEQIRRALIEIEQKSEILAELKRLSTAEEADFELGAMGGRGRPYRAELNPEEQANAAALLDELRKTAPPSIPANLCKAAAEQKAGQLTYQVPKTMRRGIADVVEVRLGLAHQEMTIGFMGSGSITIENLPIVETMTVHLYGSPGAFQITRQSRHTQLVMGSVIGASSLDHDRFGRWLWEVRPKRIGTHELTVKVSADLTDSRGVASSEPYRDRTFTVSVRVNYQSASLQVLKWMATGAVTALVGAYTQDVWWPKVKVWLMDVGLLS